MLDTNNFNRANRNAIGIDINEDALKIAKKNLKFKCETSSQIVLIKDNATNLQRIPTDSIDLICTHLPYVNISVFAKIKELFKLFTISLAKYIGFRCGYYSLKSK